MSGSSSEARGHSEPSRQGGHTKPLHARPAGFASSSPGEHVEHFAGPRVKTLEDHSGIPQSCVVVRCHHGQFAFDKRLTSEMREAVGVDEPRRPLFKLMLGRFSTSVRTTIIQRNPLFRACQVDGLAWRGRRHPY